MANDQNRWFGTGHLGRDPEGSAAAPGKKARSTFSIAVNRNYANADGETKESATWINCVAFDRVAEFCYQYLKKGQFVVVQGEIQVRKYTGRDGAEKTSTEIVVREITAPGGARPSQDAQPANEGYGAPSQYNSPPAGGYREAPRESSPIKPDTRTQEELYDKATGSPIITDDDIPF
jgi:single-strand DNA-binding protein